MPRWLIDSLATGGPALVVADAVAKATILLCLTTAIAAALRRSAAAVRHRLWGLTLVRLDCASVPVLVAPGLATADSPIDDGAARFGASWNEGAAELGSDQAVNAGSPDGIHSTQPDLDHGRPGPTQASRPGHPKRSSGTSSRSSAVVQSLVAPGAVPRESAWIMLLWVLGFIAVALPALAGVVGNEWRRRQSRRVVDQNWLQLLDGLTRQFALRRRVELRTSPVPLDPGDVGCLAARRPLAGAGTAMAGTGTPARAAPRIGPHQAVRRRFSTDRSPGNRRLLVSSACLVCTSPVARGM